MIRRTGIILGLIVVVSSCNKNADQEYKNKTYEHLMLSYDITDIDSCIFEVIDAHKDVKVKCDCSIRFGGKIKGYVLINSNFVVIDEEIESKFKYDSWDFDR